MNFKGILLILLTISIVSYGSFSKSKDFECPFAGCSCQLFDQFKDAVNMPKIDIICNQDTFPTYANDIENEILSLEIKINNNMPNQILDYAFAYLKIEILDLSGNRIDLISEKAFDSVEYLYLLILKSNSLKKIDKKCFEPLDTLAQLDLSYNLLDEFDVKLLSETLGQLISLEKLNMEHNSLKLIPDFTGFTDLFELNLDNNLISSLYNESNSKILLNKNLVFLSMFNNKLKSIDDIMFSCQINLEYLNLGLNLIENISKDAFLNLKKLKFLYLEKNYLKGVPSDAIFNLISLERLGLSAQRAYLTEINDYSFDRKLNNVSLKVDISRNRISMLSNKAFCSKNGVYSNIDSIDMSGNLLSSINSCLMLQLSKSTNKTVNVNFKIRPVIDETKKEITCDCEVTRSAKLVKFSGTCRDNQNQQLRLNAYNCLEFSRYETREQIEQICKEKNTICD